jgi:hypothetical protein
VLRDEKRGYCSALAHAMVLVAYYCALYVTQLNQNWNLKFHFLRKQDEIENPRPSF